MYKTLHTTRRVLLVLILAVVSVGAFFAAFMFSAERFGSAETYPENIGTVKRQVILEENFVFKFTVENKTEDDAYQSARATFDFNGSKTQAVKIPENGKFVFEYDKITPQLMANKITVSIYGTKNVEGVSTEDAEPFARITTSLEDYIKDVYALEKGEETDREYEDMKILCEDLINYGIAAYAYCNEGAVSEMETLGGGSSVNIADEIKSVQSLDDGEGTTADEKLTWKSANVYFAHNISVAYKFECNYDLDTTDVKIVVVNGEEETVFTKEDFLPVLDENENPIENRYYISYAVKPSELYSALKASFYVGDELHGKTLTYSVNSYINRKYGSAEDNNLNGLIESLAKVGKSTNSILSDFKYEVSNDNLPTINSAGTATATDNDYNYSINLPELDLDDYYKEWKTGDGVQTVGLDASQKLVQTGTFLLTWKKVGYLNTFDGGVIDAILLVGENNGGTGATKIWDAFDILDLKAGKILNSEYDKTMDTFTLNLDGTNAREGEGANPVDRIVITNIKTVINVDGKNTLAETVKNYYYGANRYPLTVQSNGGTDDSLTAKRFASDTGIIFNGITVSATCNGENTHPIRATGDVEIKDSALTLSTQANGMDIGGTLTVSGSTIDLTNTTQGSASGSAIGVYGGNVSIDGSQITTENFINGMFTSSGTITLDNGSSITFGNGTNGINTDGDKIVSINSDIKVGESKTLTGKAITAKKADFAFDVVGGTYNLVSDSNALFIPKGGMLVYYGTVTAQATSGRTAVLQQLVVDESGTYGDKSRSDNPSTTVNIYSTNDWGVTDEYIKNPETGETEVNPAAEYSFKAGTTTITNNNDGASFAALSYHNNADVVKVESGAKLITTKYQKAIYNHNGGSSTAKINGDVTVNGSSENPFGVTTILAENTAHGTITINGTGGMSSNITVDQGGELHIASADKYVTAPTITVNGVLKIEAITVQTETINVGNEDGAVGAALQVKTTSNAFDRPLSAVDVYLYRGTLLAQHTGDTADTSAFTKIRHWTLGTSDVAALYIRDYARSVGDLDWSGIRSMESEKNVTYCTNISENPDAYYKGAPRKDDWVPSNNDIVDLSSWVVA